MKKCLIVLSLFIAITWSCGEGVVPNQCILAGEVEYEVSDAKGWLSFNEALDEYTVRYHVPGTIDSFLTGVVCQTFLEAFGLPEEGEVNFSGQFMEDNDRFDPNVRLGGEEFYYLNLQKIEGPKVRKVNF